MVDRGTDARVMFMSLPPEIRNRIYAFAVVHSKPLVVSRHLTQVGNQAPCKKKNIRTKTECILRSSTSTDPRTRKVPVKTAIAIDLLKVSKEISREASAVLLRDNVFIFEKPLALQQFCDALGKKVKSLAHVQVNDMSNPFANEHLCVLSSLEQPKTIVIRAATSVTDDWDIAASPSRTWELVKPVVWCMTQPLRVGMSFRPVVPMEIQRERLEAFKFEVPAERSLVTDSKAAESIADQAEREARFKTLVVECWRREASSTGVRKVREADASQADARDAKKTKRA